MSKGSIEWEHNQQDGLTIRIKPGSLESLTGMVAAAGAEASAKAGDMRQQARCARKEVLTAVRGLLDLAIQHMDDKNENASTHGTKIKVE